MIQVNIASRNKKDDDFLFLILKRSDSNIIYPSIWQVITGTIENNETAIQTAIREVFEETGLVPLKLWTIPYISSFYDYKKNEINIIPVFGMLTDFVDNISLSDEHQDFRWESYQECIKMLPLPQQSESLKIFKEYVLEKPSNQELFQIKSF
jgi:dATP pyrophosphohydrolase